MIYNFLFIAPKAPSTYQYLQQFSSFLINGMDLPQLGLLALIDGVWSPFYVRIDPLNSLFRSRDARIPPLCRRYHPWPGLPHFR